MNGNGTQSSVSHKFMKEVASSFLTPDPSVLNLNDIIKSNELESDNPISKDEAPGMLRNEIQIEYTSLERSELFIRVEDRKGLLADISTVLSASGLGIREHRGGTLEDGQGYMQFIVLGQPGTSSVTVCLDKLSFNRLKIPRTVMQ